MYQGVFCVQVPYALLVKCFGSGYALSRIRIQWRWTTKFYDFVPFQAFGLIWIRIQAVADSGSRPRFIRDKNFSYEIVQVFFTTWSLQLVRSLQRLYFFIFSFFEGQFWPAWIRIWIHWPILSGSNQDPKHCFLPTVTIVFFALSWWEAEFGSDPHWFSTDPDLAFFSNCWSRSRCRSVLRIESNFSGELIINFVLLL